MGGIKDCTSWIKEFYNVAFLENVKPRYAWISAGRKNRYGHPHKDTLERLENSGAKIYSTQENGAFGITVNKKSMRIHGRNG